MSVLIKGIKMPQCCEDCFFADYLHNECRATGNYIIRKKEEEKPSWCPIIEVPQHGRLVWDRHIVETFSDAICDEAKKTGHVRATFDEILKVVNDIPTIIEAPKEGE